MLNYFLLFCNSSTNCLYCLIVRMYIKTKYFYMQFINLKNHSTLCCIQNVEASVDVGTLGNFSESIGVLV